MRAKEPAVSSGMASEPEVDNLVSELRAAKDGDYEWVSTPFLRDLTFRRPAAS
jgi:hypothetical protein